jgi:hypothetical protein
MSSYRMLIFLKNFSKKEQYLALIRGVELSSGPFPNIADATEIFMGWVNSPQVLAIRFEDIMSSEASRYEVCEKVIRYLFPDASVEAVPRMQEAMNKQINKNDSWTFRNGRVGDWRLEFDQEMKQAFKEVAGPLLIELGYEKDLNW